MFCKKKFRERLKNAQEECESLTQNLANFLHWTNQQLKIITNAQPVGGDLGLVQAQFEVIKVYYYYFFYYFTQILFILRLLKKILKSVNVK